MIFFVIVTYSGTWVRKEDKFIKRVLHILLSITFLNDSEWNLHIEEQSCISCLEDNKNWSMIVMLTYIVQVLFRDV